jgi:hypothetical protein
MQSNGMICRDIPIQAETWEQAIEKIKHTANYKVTKMSLEYRDKKGIDDYVELYKNKLRKDLTFEDLRNPDVYRRIY